MSPHQKLGVSGLPDSLACISLPNLLFSSSHLLSFSFLLISSISLSSVSLHFFYFNHQRCSKLLLVVVSRTQSLYSYLPLVTSRSTLMLLMLLNALILHCCGSKTFWGVLSSYDACNIVSTMSCFLCIVHKFV